jgi:hypothetical protein
LRIAQAIKMGEVGVIEGSISLSRLAHSIVPDWRIDPDFLVFGVLASETDHLPIGVNPSLWSKTAFAKAQAEIERITENNRDAVIVACNHVLARFADVPTVP